MSLKEIPDSANIAIYGTGKRGRDYYKIISTCRPDVAIVCYLDSFKEDDSFSPPIIKASSVNPENANVDIILVCSEYHSEIFCHLRELGLTPHSTISTYLADWFVDILPDDEVKQCEEMFNQLLEELPDEPFVYDALGRLESQKNNFELALYYYKQAQDKFPNDIWGYAGYAKVLVEVNRYEESEEMYQSVIARFPDNPAGYLGCADVFHRMNRNEESEEMYQSVIARFPDNPIGYVGYANLLVILGRAKEAEQLLLPVEQRFANYAPLIQELQNACILQGKITEAKELLPKLLQACNFSKNRNAHRQKPLLFNHIPKCGGSSVNSFLLQNYSNSLSINTHIFFTNKKSIVDYYSSLSNEEKKFYYLFYSHGSEALLPYIPTNTIKSVVLRDPTERLFSGYFFNISKGLISESEESLFEYVEKATNVYVSMFCTSKELDELKGPVLAQKSFFNLKEQYDLIGITEKMSSFLVELQRIAELPIPYTGTRKNITAKRKNLKDIDPKVVKLANDRLHLDIELYNLVKNDWNNKASV